MQTHVLSGERQITDTMRKPSANSMKLMIHNYHHKLNWNNWTPVRILRHALSTEVWKTFLRHSGRCGTTPINVTG